jgi:hypothetical protein
MVFLWALTIAALLLAVVCWYRAKRLTRRLDELTRSYWELKYEQGEHRVQLQRLAGSPSSRPSPAQSSADVFVPLTSLKR